MERIPLVNVLYRPVAQVVEMLQRDPTDKLQGMNVVYCAFGREGGAGFLGLLVSDQVYQHIIFDGLSHLSLLTEPELYTRSFVINSFGKTYHTTGWKIGYCLAPEALSIELQKIHQYLTFASNTPIQTAYAEFMQNKDLYLSLPDFYQQKRDLFLDLIAESRFRPLPCKGTYYQMLDYSQISDEPDLAFARRLTLEHGVAAIPPSALYHQKDDHKVLRFCFAKNT